MESFFADKHNEAIWKKINLASFAINLNFDDYNSYCRRSALYESLGLFKLSLDDAVKAISIDQTKDEAFIHQAKAFTGLKKYSEAERSLNDCLRITKHKTELILNQLENLRYLAVKQIGFDDQISSLASKRFNTINDSINGAFSMDLEKEEDYENEPKKTNEHQQNNVTEISSNSIVINNSSNKNNNLTNNNQQFVNDNQLVNSNHQNSQFNNSINSNQFQTNQLINQISNGQINNHITNNQLNQLNTSQLINCTSVYLNSRSDDKGVYTSANNNNLISSASTTVISNNFSTNNNDQQQHHQQVYENPSSTTIIDNASLSEMDMQADGTDFSSDNLNIRSDESDFQMKSNHSDIQMRSDSEQTLIINSSKTMSNFTTPSKAFTAQNNEFLSDLDTDFFLSSPFTTNSNSSICFGDSLATPQFKCKESDRQIKKPRVIKNLMNDLVDNSENSPMYSPCTDTSPFSNISSVEEVNTTKSNVIVSPFSNISSVEEINTPKSNVIVSPSNSVIKSSTQNALLVPHSILPPHVQVSLAQLNKIILPNFQPTSSKVKPISTVAQTTLTSCENQKVTNCSTTDQSNYEPINIDKFFKEQNIVVNNEDKDESKDKEGNTSNVLNESNCSENINSPSNLINLLPVQSIEPTKTICSIVMPNFNPENSTKRLNSIVNKKKEKKLNQCLTRRRKIGERIISTTNICKNKLDEKRASRNKVSKIID